jgi:aldose 1-epimerase
MNISKKNTTAGEIITLSNSKTNEKAEINLTVGATLIQLDLSLNNQIESIISIPASDKYPLKENPYHPSALLAPWVNRVRNGNYSFLGRNYQLPINESNLGNAIHGFLARNPFQISQEEISEEQCKVILTYHYDGLKLDGFPFPFDFHIIYSLSNTGKFTIHFQVKNIGDSPMPFACGWHPYFGFPNTKINNYEVKFSAISKFLSDSQMIPFHSEKVDYKNGAKLSSEKLDNVFLLEKLHWHTTELKYLKNNKSIFLEHSSEIFPYFVAFVPEGYQCIALEPMTANTDAFNTHEGLLNLNPKEEFNGHVEVWIGKSIQS